MGGAPPPPQDFAPQGPKNRRNSARKRAGFWRYAGPEDQGPKRGGGGDPGHYPSSEGEAGAGSPAPPTSFPEGGGSGNRPGTRSERTGSISPDPAGNPPEDPTLVPGRGLGDGAVTGESALIARRSRNSRQFSADTGLRSTQVDHAWTMDSDNVVQTNASTLALRRDVDAMLGASSDASTRSVLCLGDSADASGSTR